jgi:hypothetical protein
VSHRCLLVQRLLAADGMEARPLRADGNAARRQACYAPPWLAPASTPQCSSPCHAASACAPRARPVAQSLGWDCRNHRLVGDSGVVSPASPQRQSGTQGRSTHTGFSRAPARSAPEMPTVRARSRWARHRAVAPSSCSTGARELASCRPPGSRCCATAGTLPQSHTVVPPPMVGRCGAAARPTGLAKGRKWGVRTPWRCARR